jgi:hypothetical protein
MFFGNDGSNLRIDPECHIPEERNSRLHCYENLSSRMLQRVYEDESNESVTRSKKIDILLFAAVGTASH